MIAMVFRGTTDATAGPNGELALPTQFGVALDRSHNGVVIRLDSEAGEWPNLQIWPKDSRVKATQDGPINAMTALDTLRGEGRLMVPHAYWRAGGFSRDLAVLGCGDHIEVWDRSTWMIRRASLLNSLGELRPILYTSQQPSTIAFATKVARSSSRLLDLLISKPTLARDLTAREFERVVAALLERQGLQVVLTSSSGDGGVDIYAVRHLGERLGLLVVDCKRYHAGLPVGIGVVRQLNGVIWEQRADAGMIVTTSRFTRGARELAARYPHRLSLATFNELIDLLRGTTNPPTSS